MEKLLKISWGILDNKEIKYRFDIEISVSGIVR